MMPYPPRRGVRCVRPALEVYADRPFTFLATKLMHAPQLVEDSAPSFGAVVARQLSVWPFASRTQRLYLLVDPSAPQPSMRAGLLRAMQQAYFRSDTFSQTRAVREAALAAHYVLVHNNRDVLPQSEVTAAAAVAAVRGGLAYVALAGNAVAFAWRDGELVGQRGTLKLARPLGLEREPSVTLWSTPLEPGDRLVLVCGAHWSADATRTVMSILRSSAPGEEAEARMTEALAANGQSVAVLVADPVRRGRPERHLVLVSSVQRGRSASASSSTPGRPRTNAPARPESRRLPRLRVAASLLLTLILGSATIAALKPPAAPPREAVVMQARALLDQADQAADATQARALSAEAYGLAQGSGLGDSDAADVATLAARKLAQVDRAVPITVRTAVRLGPSGVNVVDLAVGDALYTLDVGEGTVRAFSLDALDAAPTPDTIVARAGAPIERGRALAAPVAIRYLAEDAAHGALTIIDQARNLVSVGPDRVLTARPFSSSLAWAELGALGGDGSPNLFVVDSGSRRLLSYPTRATTPVDAPRLVIDGAAAPNFAFEHAAEIIGDGTTQFVRLDDGSIHRVDASGEDTVLDVRSPDARPTRIVGMASDRAGGLFLVDAANGRVLETDADGALIRQLRNPSFAGVRQIQSTLDGRRLYGLVASGVLVFEVPATVPGE